MYWLPPPADFRQALRDAQAPDLDTAARLDRLARLAQHRLGMLEVLQVDRVLSKLEVAGTPPSAGFGDLRLAVLGSCTTDHLLPGIRVAALARRLRVHVLNGQFGQYRQEALQPPPALAGFAPQVVLFSLDAREALAPVALDSTRQEADAHLDAYLAGLRECWRAVRRLHGASVIQQSFLDTQLPLFGSLENTVPGAPQRLVRELNRRLAQAAQEEGIALLDIDRAAARDGLSAWFDPGRWLQARMQIVPAAMPVYGELLARVLGALRGLSKKCLVLDLDNTLWGGVIGDDGLEGIVLGEGSAAGEAHLALQRYALELSRRGIILAVCSKNDPLIAAQAFDQHPDMILKRSDIACFVANWEPKESNLRRIARELNIGVDSLVFVDDNPAERAHIREALPQVSVPELPADPALFARCLADAGCFESVGFTAEDRQRSAQYSQNAARSTALESSASMEDFLAGLQMRLHAGRAAELDLARVAQLINKTNQFNLTTQRHSLEAVSAWARDENAAVLQFRLIDRFGDNGLVSAMILLRPADEPDALEIDTWVMSCRVFGRQLERSALNHAVATARAMGATRLRGNFRPTPKNAVVQSLYAELGFEPLPGGESPGETRWTLDLSGFTPFTTPITDAPG